MKYRPEIDGLRALAVMPVIFFHAGFSLFQGGFVGVDIFFVISGYLITSIILIEKEAGTFSLVNFYEHRARRILPALFLILFVCVPFAWALLIPSYFQDFSLSLISVSLFISNLYFLANSSYFATADKLLPLLHTWSLGVEEQYYLIFPVFILEIWRFGKFKVFIILTILTVISFAFAEWMSQISFKFAFFLLPARGWEIMVGGLTAFYLSESDANLYKFKKHKAQIYSTLGFLFIFFSVLYNNGQTTSSVLYTALPTLGAALIIIFATSQTWVGKTLGSRPLVAIGKISYSLYLWHLPIFVFVRIRSTEEPSALVFTCLIYLAAIFAYLSWKYVEMPFRNRALFSRRAIFLYSAIGSSFFIVFGAIVIMNKGFENRFTPEQLKIAQYEKYDFSSIYSRYKCFMEPENTYKDFSPSCEKASGIGEKYFIWGDSYGAALSYGFKNMHSNTLQYTSSMCPPTINVSYPKRPNCLLINSFILKEVEKLTPEKIFLIARWPDYQWLEKHSLKARNTAFENLGKTLVAIKNVSPNSQITIIGLLPNWEPTLPIFLLSKGIMLEKELFLQMPQYKDFKNDDYLLETIAHDNHISFVSAFDKACIKDKCPVIIKSNGNFIPTAWDSGHLTAEGSLFFAKKILQKNE